MEKKKRNIRGVKKQGIRAGWQEMTQALCMYIIPSRHMDVYCVFGLETFSHVENINLSKE